ncbi:MAG: hypothetical protein WBD40_13050, partial [Tepidisphaeraceae bacterium]
MQPQTLGARMSRVATAIVPKARWLGEHRGFVTLGASAILAINLWTWGLGHNPVLDTAYSI